MIKGSLPMDDSIQVLLSRRSERKFLDKSVEKIKVKTILDVAMNAPSAMNRQPWFFVVVDKKEILNELAKGLPYAKMAKTAPLGIVVCGNMAKTLPGKSKEFWIQDTSASTMNILNACHALKLGAVWTGVHPSKKKKAAVKEILNLPDKLIPLSFIVIGYVENINQEDKNRYKEKAVHYNEF